MFAGRRGWLLTARPLRQRQQLQRRRHPSSAGLRRSVLLNELGLVLPGHRRKIWMQDLGRSFEKLSAARGGHLIEFRPDVEISLNPFRWSPTSTRDIDMRCCRPSPRWPRCQLDEVQMKAIGDVAQSSGPGYARTWT